MNNVNKIITGLAIFAFCMTAILSIGFSDMSSADDEYDEDLGTFYSYKVRFVYQGDIGESVTSEQLEEMVSWSFSDDNYTQTYNGVAITHTFTEKGIHYVKCIAQNSQYTNEKTYKVNIYGPPTITFVSNGGSEVETITMPAYDQVAEEPEEPTKDGFTFAGWYTNDGLTIPYDWNEPVLIPITLYAKWLSNDPIVYTITFVSNGGSAVAPVNVEYNNAATQPNAPVRSGYTFTKWYTDSELKYAYDWTSLVTGDFTLYAGWVKNPATQYTITFNTNGGSEIGSMKVDAGTKAVAPTQPTKDGFTFAGWYKDSEFASAVDWNAAITGNVTYYAKWTENAPAPADDTKDKIIDFVKNNLWIVFAVLCGIFALLYFVSYIQHPIVLILMLVCGVFAALFGFEILTVAQVDEFISGFNL